LRRDAFEDRVLTCLHLLGTPARGDVLARAEHPHRVAFGIDFNHAIAVQGANRSVSANDALVVFEWIVVLCGAFDDALHALPVERMHEREIRFERRGVLLRHQAIDPVQLGRPRHRVGDDVPLPVAHVRDLLRIGEHALVVAQHFLDLLASADVDEMNRQAVR